MKNENKKLAADKDMETQVKRTTENNKNPGSFQRLV